MHPLQDTSIKMPKIKERILKAAREKQFVSFRGFPIRLLANYVKETLLANRDWQEIFKVMKSGHLQTRLFYSVKLLFIIKGQIKSFPDKKKLKDYFITKPLLCVMLKGLI